MTPHDIARIRADFGRIAADADGFAATFYNRLFQIDPSLRAMFPSDLRPQRQKLVQALALVVNALDRLGTILDGIRDLGVRHGAYGVKPHHYTLVAEALLDALDSHLDGMTEASRSAWVRAYATLSDVMIEAADDAARPALAS